MSKKETRAFIDQLDGPVAVATLCGITHGAVCQWKYIPNRFLATLLAEAQRRKIQCDVFDLLPKPVKGRLRQNPK